MLAGLLCALEPSSWKRTRHLNNQRQIKQNALQKQVIEDLAFIRECPEYESITESRKKEIRNIRSAVMLHQMLKEGKTTCVELIIIMGELALTLGYKLNLITASLVRQAYHKAKNMDQHLYSHLHSPNPSIFYGLPITLKDNFIKKDTDCTLGCAAYVNQPHSSDGLLTRFIEQEVQGIVIAKSNIPQLMMLNESLNDVFGKAMNPLDIGRTPGGSSGGEGGLVALGASMLGIGSDIGGSLRIPAMCTGTVSFKATENRTTSQGMYTPEEYKANINVVTVPGGITHDTADLIHFQTMLINSPMIKAHEFTKIMRPFDTHMYERPNGDAPIRIGYLITDDFFPVCISTQRGITQVIDTLKNDSRYQLVDLAPLRPFDSKAIIRTFLGIMSAEGKLRNFFRLLAGDKMIKEYNLMVSSSRIPGWLRPFIVKILGWLGEHRLGWVVGSTNELSYDSFQLLSIQQQSLQHSFYQFYLQHDLSAIILPGMVSPAIKHHCSKSLFLHVYYTFMFNLLKCPAGVLPITRVLSDEQVYAPEGYQQDSLHKKTVEQMEGSQGMPVSVQVVGLPGQDEKVLRIMSDLESLIQYRQTHGIHLDSRLDQL